MAIPSFRYASSRSRPSRISNLNVGSSKISRSGLNVIVVPVFAAFPTFFSVSAVFPRAKAIRHACPSRRTSARSHSDSAFTTDTPTPCSPPDTL